MSEAKTNRIGDAWLGMAAARRARHARRRRARRRRRRERASLVRGVRHEQQKTIEGTVSDFQWTNPHTWTWVDVKGDDGSVTKYGFEGMSPNFLGRRGWSKNTLKPGDHVKIVYAPLKSGEPGGTFLRATLKDGTEMVMFGGGPVN